MAACQYATTGQEAPMLSRRHLESHQSYQFRHQTFRRKAYRNKELLGGILLCEFGTDSALN